MALFKKEWKVLILLIKTKHLMGYNLNKALFFH
jgi:hypothetical protein